MSASWRATPLIEPARAVDGAQDAGAANVAPGISVAIATRNRPDALALCLDAILAGDTLPAEIVVADQSGDSRTRRVVEQRRCAATRLVYLRHAGSGLGAAQNLAMTRASGAVIAVTDDDCVPERDWVRQVARAFGSDSKVGALTGRILPLAAEASGHYPVATRVSTTRHEFDRPSLPWNVGSGNNFAVRRGWLARIGGNDERLGPGSPGQGGVDMDLFYRLLRAGARIRYEPDLLVYHAQTDRAGRLARRRPYGHGIGACCSLWLRQGDFYALRVLGGWLAMRGRRLLGGLWRREWMLAHEEVLVLLGTIDGLFYGWRVGGQPAPGKALA